MNFHRARATFNRISTYLPPRWRAVIFYTFVFGTMAVGVFQAVSQYRETGYVNQVARNITAGAGSTDTMSTLIALRDYLHQNVRRDKFPARGRPFLRNTAAETLASGKGRCGESTRAFINMASGLGIRAQRLYLEGQRSHVVALVTLDDGQQVIVDSSDRPYFHNIERFDQLSEHREFDYHSSFNRRRMVVALRSNSINLGPLSYFFENPNALFALVAFALAFGCVGIRWLGHPIRNWRKGRATTARAAKEWQTAAPNSATV